MTIKQIETERYALERLIRQLAQDFYARTGVPVDTIAVSHLDCTTLASERLAFSVESVDVRLVDVLNNSRRGRHA